MGMEIPSHNKMGTSENMDYLERKKMMDDLR